VPLSAYLLLAAAALFVVLFGARRAVLSVPTMFFLGTALFLYPGALLREAVLWTVRPDTEMLAFFAIAVTLLGVVLGYRAASSLVGKPAGLEPPVAQVSTTTLWALLVLSVFIKTFMDPDTLVGHLITHVDRPSTVAGQYLSILIAIPTALGCLAPWLWRNRRHRTAGSAFVIVALVLVGLFGLSRTPIFYILGTIALSKLWRADALWRSLPRRFVGACALALFAPLLVYFAALVKGTNFVLDYAASGELDLAKATEYAAESQFRLATSDAYGNFLFVLDNYPEKYSYLPGHSLAVLGTALVPRAIFEAKPWSASYVLTGQMLGEGTFEQGGTILATSLVGELWMNGGALALGLGSLLVGAFGGVLGSSVVRGRFASPREPFYMGLVMFVLIPRGDLLATLFRGTIYIAVACVLLWLLTSPFESPKARSATRCS